MGTQLPFPPKKQFSAHVYCGQTAGCTRIRFGTEVGLSPGDIVLDGDPAPPPLKVTAPNFRLMSVVAQRLDGVRCHLTGVEVGLGPGEFVLGGDPDLAPKQGYSPTQFSAHVYCGQTAGWINMPLVTEVGFGPDDVVLDGTQLPHP